MQHIALKTNCLEATRAFYAEVLGLPKVQAKLGPATSGSTWPRASYYGFDRTDEAPDPSALVYLGLELESFTAVDERFARVSLHTPIERDLREEYRHRQGPYGFMVRDPQRLSDQDFQVQPAVVG